MIEGRIIEMRVTEVRYDAPMPFTDNKVRVVVELARGQDLDELKVGKTVELGLME